MYRGGIHGNYDITVIYEESDGISNVYMYKVVTKYKSLNYVDKWGRI